MAHQVKKLNGQLDHTVGDEHRCSSAQIGGRKSLGTNRVRVKQIKPVTTLRNGSGHDSVDHDSVLIAVEKIHNTTSQVVKREFPIDWRFWFVLNLNFRSKKYSTIGQLVDRDKRR